MIGAKKRIILLPGTLAICRLETTASMPAWATLGPFCSVTRTEEELSVVCPEARVPQEVKRETGWRALKIEGPLDFSLTGILASLIAPLAGEKVSVFAISTYDTDYLLVKEEQLAKAIEALRGEGYKVKTRVKVQGSRRTAQGSRQKANTLAARLKEQGKTRIRKVF